MLSPDQWCAYDSTKAGLHRLYEQGISKYDALTAIPPDRMQLAIEQLPEVRPPPPIPQRLCTSVCTCCAQFQSGVVAHLT